MRLKQGDTVVYTATFATKQEADEAERRQRAILQLGVDLHAGRQRLEVALREWMTVRKSEVAESTYARDASVLNTHIPTNLLRRQLASVTVSELQQLVLHVNGSNGTRRKVKTVLQAFYSWCVRTRKLPYNLMTDVRLPRDVNDTAREMRPLLWDELEECARDVATYSTIASRIVLVLGYTGLRWGEARALKVEDIQEVPHPAFLVRRSWTEGYREKSTKSYQTRRVPIPSRAWPLVKSFASGKSPKDRVFTSARGNPLHKSNFRRSAHWSTTMRGRRIHDLRHTAATNWLLNGVNPRTVQAWLGHRDLSTTEIYIHYIGTSADETAIALVNSAVSSTGPSAGSTAKNGEPHHVA